MDDTRLITLFDDYLVEDNHVIDNYEYNHSIILKIDEFRNKNADDKIFFYICCKQLYFYTGLNEKTINKFITKMEKINYKFSCHDIEVICIMKLFQEIKNDDYVEIQITDKNFNYMITNVEKAETMIKNGIIDKRLIKFINSEKLIDEIFMIKQMSEKIIKQIIRKVYNFMNEMTIRFNIKYLEIACKNKDHMLLKYIYEYFNIKPTETCFLMAISNRNKFLSATEINMIGMLVNKLEDDDNKNIDELNYYITDKRSDKFLKNYIEKNNIIPNITTMTYIYKSYNEENVDKLIEWIEEKYDIKPNMNCMLHLLLSPNIIFKSFHGNITMKKIIKFLEINCINNKKDCSLLDITQGTIDDFRLMFNNSILSIDNIKKYIDNNHYECDIYCLRYACKCRNSEIINYIIDNYDIIPDKECLKNVSSSIIKQFFKIDKVTFKKLIRAYFKNH